MQGQSRTMARVGWALSALVMLVLVADSGIDLLKPALVAEPMTATGWAFGRAPILGAITLACALLYAIPRTAVLGAILTVGFFAGAIATHLRVEAAAVPEIWFCLVMGAAAWGGLWLRDARLRALLPLSS